MERGGPPATWYDSRGGSIVSNGHASWTYRNTTRLDNYIKWKPPLDRCGVWEVFAYIPLIPNGLRDTTNAVYTIRHRGGSAPAAVEATRTVDMDAVNKSFGDTRIDRWHSLGTYLFSAGNAGEYVLLGDTTGERAVRGVVFDDMRWVYLGPDDAACNPPAPSPTPTTAN